MPFAAAIGVLGAVVAGKIASSGAEKRNEAQINQANTAMMFTDAQVQRQMDFQERMSNTAHQRQIADMSAAGLNPILSARYGGSSTPSGGAGTGQQANILDESAAGVSSAMTARRLSADIRSINEDVKVKKETAKNLKASNWNIEQDSALKKAQMENTDQATQVQQERQKFIPLQRQGLEYQLEGLKVEAGIDQTQYGKVVRWLQRLNPFVGSAAQLTHPGRSRR